jgi:hypothetical protein
MPSSRTLRTLAGSSAFIQVQFSGMSGVAHYGMPSTGNLLWIFPITDFQYFLVWHTV